MTTSDHKFTSLVNAVQGHAVTHFEDRAYVFLDERGEENASLTWAELNLRAALVASTLTARLRPGDRVLLVFPPRLDFIVAFLLASMPACLPCLVFCRASAACANQVSGFWRTALPLWDSLLLGPLNWLETPMPRFQGLLVSIGSVLFPRNLPVPRPM